VTRRPLVFAHRGASGHAPENTVAAFLLAHELGADGVELDVRRTADDVLVVHHDPGVDGVGLIVETTFAALRASRPELPTLAEAFDACRGVTVNVEVKCLPWEPDADPEHGVVRRSIDLARECGIDFFVSSFDIDTVDAARAHAPDHDTGFLVHSIDPVVAGARAREHGHAWVNPDRASVLAAPESVAACHDLGVRVAVWTVDAPDDIRALAGAGVDAIITNLPDVALAALAG